MKKLLFPGFVTLFWLLMMALLIRQEFFQFAPVKSPYEVLPILSAEIREEYRGIYLGDNLIGFTVSVLEKEDDLSDLPAETAYELRQNTYMTFLFLGQEREMLIRSKAYLDKRLELLLFETRVSSGEYWTGMKGQIAGDMMNLIIEDKEGDPVEKRLPVESPLFFSESVTFLWTPDNLKAGRHGRLNVWNPLLLNFEDLEFRVGPKSTVEHLGEEKEAYRVAVTEQGMDTHYWITPEGVVLKYESPTGLVMVKQEGWRIFDALREGREELTDLPNLYSVPSNRKLESPEALNYLKIRIGRPDSGEILEIRRPSLEEASKTPMPASSDPEMAPYLEATEFIQSEDPMIANKAREVAGRENNVADAAARLMLWVHQRITPTPTVSIPSAVQVMKNSEGDCNEYTALFTAMARSLGIPTKMVAGLVYQKGRFFYHAWPEIFAGEWIGIDPTFFQFPNDVTHIPLVEGELEKQIDLIKQLGKIELEILETA